MLLEGKVILVTGGGRGIGAAICRVLARHDAAVAVNYGQSADKQPPSSRRFVPLAAGRGRLPQTSARRRPSTRW